MVFFQGETLPWSCRTLWCKREYRLEALVETSFPELVISTNVETYVLRIIIAIYPIITISSIRIVIAHSIEGRRDSERLHQKVQPVVDVTTSDQWGRRFLRSKEKDCEPVVFMRFTHTCPSSNAIPLILDDYRIFGCLTMGINIDIQNYRFGNKKPWDWGKYVCNGLKKRNGASECAEDVLSKRLTLRKHANIIRNYISYIDSCNARPPKPKFVQINMAAQGWFFTRQIFNKTSLDQFSK